MAIVNVDRVLDGYKSKFQRIQDRVDYLKSAILEGKITNMEVKELVRLNKAMDRVKTKINEIESFDKY